MSSGFARKLGPVVLAIALIFVASASFATPAVAANDCGAPATFIHEVQGDGYSSPLVGEEVTVEGVVVADFQPYGGLGGFFVQEEDKDADKDKETSEGIFVYNYWYDVEVGDIVRLSNGDVVEYNGLTELSAPWIDICGTAGDKDVSPAKIHFPLNNEELEWFEGMLVTFPQELYLTETYDLGEYGEALLSANDRLYIPTNKVAPGPAAVNRMDKNAVMQILLDDGSTWSNIPMANFPFTADDGDFRLGDSVTGLTGALYYSFGDYKVEPVGDPVFVGNNPRPNVPEVGGSLTVASFNVLNYFLTLDTSSIGPVCGPDNDQDCRGARSASQFDLQSTKIVNALTELDADVVGLMEIENTTGVDAVADLVNRLNSEVGAGTYAFIDANVIGTDAIKVALIYQPASVTPVGDYAILDSSVDPNFIDTKNRPVLAQTFMENASGEMFTVAVNHLKSKGSDCEALDDPDTGDGQGNCNLTRTAAAEALAQWLASDPTGSGDPDFLIIGDLNSYAMEDPIKALQQAGYANLLGDFQGPWAYTYVYFGEAGQLDYGMSNAALTSQVTGAEAWHINADEMQAMIYYLPSGNSYKEETLWRSSDHDPVLIGLNLGS